MTGMASRLRSVLTLAVLVCAALVAQASTASAQQVRAGAQVVSVVESGAYIDVQLKVVVTNQESAPAQNVFVTFEDGLQISLGDIAAGQSAVSATQSESIDVSSRPTHHVPVPVKVTFTYEGTNVEQAQTLVIDRPAAPNAGQ